jgi:hypothetical protein
VDANYLISQVGLLMMGLAPEASRFSMKMGMPFFSLVKEKIHSSMLLACR